VKPFGTISLDIYAPPGRDDDESIFADSETLDKISGKVLEACRSFLPPGWTVSLDDTH
jgi:hypothetical protein